MWEILAGLAKKYIWKFYLDDDDLWRWVKQRKQGKKIETVDESAMGFADAKDAKADAEKRGYFD